MEDLRSLISEEAKRIGADPLDLATVISYETGGTFDPWQKGPTTKWGQHVGLIQMGEPQRKKYGYTPDADPKTLMKAVGDYLVDSGFKPGMGLLDLYSTINAGSPGRYNAKDGATSVAEKVYEMQGAHRTKADQFLGGTFAPTPRPLGPVRGPLQVDPTNELKPIDTTSTLQNIPLDPLTAKQQWLRENTEWADRDQVGVIGGVQAAIGSEWSIAWALAQNPMIADDPDYTPAVKAEDFKRLSANLPEDYWGSLQSANSAAQMEQAAEVAKNDIANTQALASLGWGGTALQIGAAILDPVAIGAAALTEGTLGPALAAAKVGRIGRILGTAFVSGASNAAAEAAVGIWNPRVDGATVAESFGIGAILGGAIGAISRKGLLRDQADQLVDIGRYMASGQSSAGAARTPGTRTHNIDGPLLDLLEGDVARPALEAARVDVAALAGKYDDAARLVAQGMVQEGVGLRDPALTIETPVTVRKQMLQYSSTNTTTSEVAKVYKGWLEEANLSHSEDRWADFNRRVTQEMDTRTGEADQHVKAAVSAYDRFYDRYHKLAENPGVESGKLYDPIPGLSHKRDNYRPMYSDVTEIQRLLQAHGEDRLVRVIKGAFKDQVDDLEDELADRLAKKYFARISRVGYGINEGFGQALSKGDKAELLDFLHNDLELSKADADALTEKIMKMDQRPEDSKSPTPRGKRRASINYNYAMSFGDGSSISVRDFFLKDADQIMHRYADETSGHIALAQMVLKDPVSGRVLVNGVRTKGEWTKIIDQIKERMVGQDPKKVAGTVERLQYLYDHVTGRPRLGEKANASWASWLRRVSTLQFLRLMQNMGLNQAQELVNIPTQVGLKAFIQGVPAFKLVLRAKGQERDEVLQELMAATGVGYDSLLNFVRHRHIDDAYGETFGSGRLDRAGQAFDKFATKGKRLINTASGMQYINSMTQQWAMKAVAQKFAHYAAKNAAKLADGTFNLKDVNNWIGWKDANRLRVLGLDDKKMTGILKNMLQHSKGVDGSKLKALNLDNWDATARADFAEALYQWTGRVIQYNDVGNMAMVLTHPVAQMFAQFRSFVFAAYAKQTLYGIKHADPRTLGNMLFQIGAGAGIWYLMEGFKSLGEKDPEEFMKDKDSLSRLATAGIGRSGISSILPMFIDLGAIATANDRVFDVRTSGQPSDVIFGSPAISHFNDILSTFQSTSDIVKEQRAPAQTEIKRLVRSTVGNWLPMITGLSYLIQDLPATAPKN